VNIVKKKRNPAKRRIPEYRGERQWGSSVLPNPPPTTTEGKKKERKRTVATRATNVCCGIKGGADEVERWDESCTQTARSPEVTENGTKWFRTGYPKEPNRGQRGPSGGRNGPDTINGIRGQAAVAGSKKFSDANRGKKQKKKKKKRTWGTKKMRQTGVERAPSSGRTT